MQGYITAVLFFCFPGLSTVAKLIGCNINELKLALSKRNMRVNNDTIVQKLTLSQFFLFASRPLTQEML
jgi:hypothetical protein